MESKEMEALMAKHASIIMSRIMEHIDIKVQTIQDQIQTLKRDFGVIRAEVNNIREDLHQAKQTISNIDEKIEKEMEERIAKEAMKRACCF